MNRCQLSESFLTSCINFMKLGEGPRKTRLWIEKWNPPLDKGVLMYKGKPLLPKEAVPGILEHEVTKNGAPMTSRDSLYKYVQQLYWGIKKNDCDKFLKSLEFYRWTHYSE